MRELIQEMIHYRNSLYPGVNIDHDKVAIYETKYQDILDIAKEEYEYVPPGNYYKDGYNLKLLGFSANLFRLCVNSNKANIFT